MFHLGAHPEARRLLRSRLYLIGLALMFAGPLIASAVLYYNPQLRAGLGGESHGTLILPPQPLPRALFRPPEETPRWTLLYFAHARDCGLDCEATLFLMRQVRASLGSRRPRTRIKILLAEESLQDRYRDVLGRHAAEDVGLAPQNPAARLPQDLPRDRLLLVDPLGNLLMQYDAQSTSRGVLKDLKRLLAASRIG